MEIEVLLEYKGSRRTITCPVASLRDRILVVLGLPDTFGKPESNYILQRFSSKWQTFVDVTKIEDEVLDGDRLTVIPNEIKV